MLLALAKSMGLKDNGWTLITNSQATPPSNIGGLDYYEAQETEKGNFVAGSSSITRVFYCDWSQSLQFVLDLLGYGSLERSAYTGSDQTTMFSKITRGTSTASTLPDEDPWFTNFFAQDASIEGVGQLGYDTNGTALNPTRATYQLAKVTATYRPAEYAITDQTNTYLGDDKLPNITVYYGPNDANSVTVQDETKRFVSRSYKFHPDYLTVNGNLKFVATQRLLPSQPGFVVGALEKTLTWHHVPAYFDNPFVPPVLTTVMYCLGRVNSRTFDGNPPGTCLFMGCETKMTTKQTMPALVSDFTWDISYTFMVKDFGFNSTYNEEMGHQYLYDIVGRPNPAPVIPAQWDLVTADGTRTGNRIYQTCDLNQLFLIQDG